MKKSNRGQVVGNLAGRASVHPKQEKVRRLSEESLITQYQVARMECGKNANRKNRRRVDSLKERMIRRQTRAIQRNHKVRAEQQAKMVRAAEAKLAAAEAVLKQAKTPQPSV